MKVLERKIATPVDAIDSRRQAEAALVQTQSALALAMRGGRMGWWQRDLRTEVVTWSPELEELFGLPAGTFAGDEGAFLSLVHPDDRHRITDAVSTAIATGGDYVVEFRFRRADHSWGWMEGRGRATYEDGRATILYGLGIDITGRKEDEASIRAREERLRLAAEAGNFGVYDYDLVTGGSYWSPELLRILALDDALPIEVAPVHPDDRDEVLRRFLGAREPDSEGTFDHEYRVVRGDGSVRWVSTHGQTFFSAPEPGPDRQALRQIGVVFDVTERRHAEELRDVFVGMLSHELRTPVTAIYGGSQVLRRENVDPKVRDEIILDIVGESERLERLVENLLVLARAERHATLAGGDPVVIRPLLARILEDKRRRWPGATFEVEIEGDIPPVRSDEASLDLIIRNLISNALKYGSPTGTVTITAARHGDMVEIGVEDEGPGVPAEGADRLFDLFYRAEDAQLRAQGAGIGLFVVRALTEAAGGHVQVTNRSAGGARFTVSLPVFADPDLDDSDD